MKVVEVVFGVTSQRERGSIRVEYVAEIVSDEERCIAALERTVERISAGSRARPNQLRD